MTLFLFTDDLSPHGPGRLVMRVPPKIRDKRAVLACYAEGLRFPDYFGWNWDALEDCLRDLAWIAEDEITIVHADRPLKEVPHDEAIYREILKRAVRDGQKNGRRRLTVVFPVILRNEMAGLDLP